MDNEEGSLIKENGSLSPMANWSYENTRNVLYTNIKMSLDCVVEVEIIDVDEYSVNMCTRAHV
jgi:hypothetical protein